MSWEVLWDKPTFVNVLDSFKWFLTNQKRVTRLEYSQPPSLKRVVESHKTLNPFNGRHRVCATFILIGFVQNVIILLSTRSFALNYYCFIFQSNQVMPTQRYYFNIFIFSGITVTRPVRWDPDINHCRASRPIYIIAFVIYDRTRTFAFEYELIFSVRLFVFLCALSSGTRGNMVTGDFTKTMSENCRRTDIDCREPWIK